jgi:L,D-peptidoglycan transpeptidase YkuD (ErfK/YbiS/YcfS/YnhG family)
MGCGLNVHTITNFQVRKVVILHNNNPVEKGKGNAIFFHVWRSEGAPTLGCTSMRKPDLLTLMKWLDPDKDPVVVQVPESELENLKLARNNK